MTPSSIPVPAENMISPTQPMENQNKPRKESFGRNLMAGGMSGIIAKTIGAPIDRVKLLIQTQSINTNLSVKYKNPIDCVVRVYRDQGLLSFWRGNLANVYRYFPSQAMNFAFKDKYTAFFGKLFKAPGDGSGSNALGLSEKYTRMVVSLLSGGLAGATALFVSYPFDVARTRLAVDVGSSSTTSTRTKTASSNSGSGRGSSSGGSSRMYSGTFQCLQSTYQLEGVRGIYSGFGVSLSGVILFRALYLGGWDIVKDHYEIEHAPFMTRFIAAQAVTTIVGTFCFPIDTVKRRLMVQRKLLPVVADTATLTGITTTSSSSSSAVGSTTKPTAARALPHIPYKNGLDCVRRILLEEGVKGLFAGLSVNIVRGFTGAVLLVAYDDIKKRL